MLRLTAPERDAWTKRVSSKFCCAARVRRGTTLIVASVVPDSQSQPSSVLAKAFSAKSFALRRPDASERVAAAHERHAVVKQFHARMILVDMWGELAGIYTDQGTLLGALVGALLGARVGALQGAVGTLLKGRSSVPRWGAFVGA